MTPTFQTPRAWDDELPPQPAPRTGLVVADYLRRIHWWVRLFGICWLVTVGLAVLGVVFMIIGMSRTAPTSGY